MSITNRSPRTNIILKAVMIFILALVLLIPTGMIMGIISERETRHDEAISDVGGKWGGQQTITGPVLTIPYVEYVTQEPTTVGGKKEVVAVTHYANFLPEKLNITSDVLPEKRNRSIFEVVVYVGKLNISGDFGRLDFEQMGIKPADVDFKGAKLNVGVSDLRGIDKSVALTWNGATTQFNPGVSDNEILAHSYKQERTAKWNRASSYVEADGVEAQNTNAGINAVVAIPSSDTAKQQFKFSFDLALKGSNYLEFTPVGKETNVKMTSKWASPSFSGAFLPDARTVSDAGFTANWNILNLNRNFPQQWANTTHRIADASFGVNLLLPVDNYQQSMRSVKYAILFIALTFMIFFFVEVLNKRKIHPFQYILVGIALVIFYTLLVSISEYLRFSFAYWLSSGATVALIGLYTWAIFDVKKLAALVAGTLTVLYGFIYVLLQLEDKALLVGSIGLFFVLALIMYYSRKIDWYNIGVAEDEADVAATNNVQ
jgi:inner membrane protein